MPYVCAKPGNWVACFYALEARRPRLAPDWECSTSSCCTTGLYGVLALQNNWSAWRSRYAQISASICSPTILSLTCLLPFLIPKNKPNLSGLSREQIYSIKKTFTHKVMNIIANKPLNNNFV